MQDIIGVVLTEMADKLKNNRVTVDLADDLPLVPMDFVLMTRVFINLVDNAHKYSAPGTPIEISATSNTNRLELKVADRGIGIPPEELARVFEKFYRVRRSDGAGGTGLGLSICRGIVELHGGQVWASNRLGGGTVVTISLPVDPVGIEPGGDVV